MVRNASFVALAGLARAFAAGCGDDAKREVADAKPRPAKVKLERFLMQAGEELGFKPVESPRVDSAVEAFGLPAAGVKRLRDSGYVSTTFQGRCKHSLGNEGEGNLVKPLSIGAKTISDRTNGMCPA